jgi:HK97 family phage portal protein|tara:strand:- start:2911 stop:4947 length:2037 start_codon:yes stop_codon:yes gene_type:complete
MKTIYGPDGNALPLEESITGNAHERRTSSMAIRRSYSNYISSLFGLNADAAYRATEPFENHAWVYCTAMVRAINLSQAPFYVYRETESVQRERLRTKAFPRAGKSRRAVQRHLTKSANPARFSGLKVKALAPDFNHPVYQVLMNANENMTGAQLWQATELFMALKGEAFWLLGFGSDSAGGRGDIPTEIHPLNPDAMKEVIDKGQLVGWEYNLKAYKGGEYSPVTGKDSKVFLSKNQVLHFKYINPENMIRGFAPVGPTAMAIKTDMLSKQHNQSVLENGANPGGILIDKGGSEPWTAEEEENFVERWEQRHRGPGNRSELAILTGSLEYVPVGMSPRDMDYIDSIKYNREEVFGTMRVPKSVAGITEQINYATQLGQDFNFWDKCLLPEVRYFEDVLDGSLFFSQTDDVVGAFDLSGIEALRQSLIDKIDVVDKLTAQNIHMPPSLAFEVAGLTVPGYPGDDTAFSNPTLVPTESVVEDEANADPDPEDIRPTIKPRTAPVAQDSIPEILRSGAEESLASARKEYDKAWKQAIVQIQKGVKEKNGSFTLDSDDCKSAIYDSFKVADAVALTSAYTFSKVADLKEDCPEIDHPKVFAWLKDSSEKLWKTTFLMVSESLNNCQSEDEVERLMGILLSDEKAGSISDIQSKYVFNGVREQFFEASGSTKERWVCGNGCQE